MRKTLTAAGVLVAFSLAIPNEALAQSRTLTGAAIGAGAGAVVAGPPGAVVGGAVGAYVGGPKLPRSKPVSCYRDNKGVRHCR